MEDPIANGDPTGRGVTLEGPNESGGRVLLPAIGLILAVSFLSYQGLQGWFALDSDDTNHLETPLILATARQLADGPSTLYGPFSGTHPLVLIHAPLYYRLAALGAWPIVLAGLNPVAASLASGRLLAMLGLLATMFAAGRIARIEGPKGAGPIAALLLGSSPVFGSFGFTVRPDTLGIALQTVGFGLSLKALHDGPAARTSDLLLAGFAFGMASCVKQHLLVAASVAALLLMVSAVLGRLPRGATLLALMLGAAVPVAYYGWEESITGGMMSRSVFWLPSRLRQTAPPKPGHVLAVFLGAAKLAIGLIAVGATLLAAGGRRVLGNRVDAALGLVLVAEIAAMVPLCLGSEGAWVNYAMPATVWASILIGRALVRVLVASPRPGWRALLIVLAALVLLARNLQLAWIPWSDRRDERATLALVFADPTVASIPPPRRYFAARPQYNRLYGQGDAAHDEWLYEAYEQEGMAEPRSRWLRDRLLGRTDEGAVDPRLVTLVVVPSKEPAPGVHETVGYVSGVPAALPDLGFRLARQYSKYSVWVRDETAP